MSLGYNDEQPTREEIDDRNGNIALEFGQNWCGYCKAAKPFIDGAMAARDIDRVKVADGKGLPLGRSFQVKLWPTVIILKDGVEVERLVRPQSEEEVAEALDRAGIESI